MYVGDDFWLVQLLVARRGSQGPASPLAGRLSAMKQQAQAEAAASSKKEASTSGPAARVSDSSPALTHCRMCHTPKSFLHA